jgi:uncharacterized protein
MHFHFIFIAAALILLLIVLVGLYGSFEITRVPYLKVPYTPADFGWAFEAVQFKSFDGLDLAGWFIPATSPNDKTILIQHGVGSNAGDMLLNTACLQKAGDWNLFYFNFRGHGDSGGERTSLGPLELRDMETAIAFIQKAKPQACRRLAVYGHSLGAAVAIVGASVFPEIQAVAAESPFSYISKTVRHFSWAFYGIPYFPFVPLSLFFTSLRLGLPIGNFAPADAIGRIAPRPIFLIFAERDARMPPADAELLWEAARMPKERWMVRGADHGEPWLIAKEEYERKLVDFFKRNF